jgi:hypothetical protein
VEFVIALLRGIAGTGGNIGEPLPGNSIVLRLGDPDFQTASFSAGQEPFFSAASNEGS